MMAEPKTQDLVITRTLAAPVARVWKAWTDSADVQQWWGPTGFTAPLVRLDVRVGGTSLLCMRAPEDFGGQEHYSIWHYREIVPLERIEYIHNLADPDGYAIDPASVGMPPDFPRDQRHVITFRAVDDQQTELTVTEYGWTIGQMMAMSELGMNQCLDKLATLLARD